MSGVFGFHVYHFAEELDVDSLGAIFEQSLKDIPHESRGVRGRGDAEVSKREIGGVYYTSRAITQYMVHRAIEYVLEPERTRLLKEVDASLVKGRQPKFAKKQFSADETRDLMFLQAMLERLKTLTVLDPACGSGAFLVQAFERLHEEYEAVTSAMAELSSARPMFGLDRLILRSNLFGTDILPESVEISKLSIWLRTASAKEPLEKLDTTIRTADALAPDDERIYDIVVSNPPWGADLPATLTPEVLRQRFPHAGQEQDTYALFIIRSWELLKPGGVLSFIVPNSWLTVQGYAPFRRWILDAFNVLEIVNVWKIFPDVNNDDCIVIARKRRSQDEVRPETMVACLTRGTTEDSKCQQLAEERWDRSFSAASAEWLKEPEARFETMYEPTLAKELWKLAKRSRPLETLFDVTVGIQVYHHRKVDKSVIAARAFHSTHRRGADWHPYIDANEVQRYFQVPASNAFLLYSDRLCDKRELGHYARPRVLVQQIFWNRLSASFSEPEGPVLYLNTLFSCSEAKTDLTLQALTAILNSRFISAAYERWSNRLFGDKFPKVSRADLARLPIPQIGRSEARALHTLGVTLGEQWQQLKTAVSDFCFLLDVKDAGGSLRKELLRFWELDKRDVGHAVSKSLPGVSAKTLTEVVTAWATATKDVNRTWAQISQAEGAVEDAVRSAYKIKDAVYNELTSRGKGAELIDVLLPKEKR